MEPTALYLARILDGYGADALADGCPEVADDLFSAAKELRRLLDGATARSTAQAPAPSPG